MKNSMKTIVLFSLTLSALAPLAAQTARERGTEIMEMVENRPESDADRSRMSMTITDRRGRTRQRSILSFTMKNGGTDYSLMVFLEPSDVRDVGLLSVDEGGGEENQWLYMPALKRTQRIASSSKGDSFMGTDFSYEDLEPRDAGDSEHAYLRDETQGGKDCWVVESVPIDESSYGRMVSWIDPETLFAVRVDFYESGSDPVKRLIVSDLRREGPYWVAGRMEMANLEKGRSTLLEMEEYRADADLDAGFFSVGTLERGVPR